TEAGGADVRDPHASADHYAASANAQECGIGRVDHVHLQDALPIRLGHIRPVHDLEEIDAIEQATGPHGLAPILVAAEVQGHGAAGPRIRSVARSCVGQMTYWTDTPSSASCAWTTTLSSWMTSASH